MEIDFPEEVSNLVEKRGGAVADWKYERDRVSAQRDELLALARDANAMLGDRDKTTDELIQLISQLCAKIAELEAPSLPDAPSRPLGAKERDSLLKLVIGMAVTGYKYDPGARKSFVPKEISQDLDRLGVGLDPNTVRKWLKAASELLPPSEQT